MTEALGLSENQVVLFTRQWPQNQSFVLRNMSKKKIKELIDAGLVNEAAESAATHARDSIYNNGWTKTTIEYDSNAGKTWIAKKQ